MNEPMAAPTATTPAPPRALRQRPVLSMRGGVWLLLLAAAWVATSAAAPAQTTTQYIEVRTFNADQHRGRRITFTGEIIDVRPTRNNDHLRVRVRGAESTLLVFIPSTTLATRPHYWNLAPGASYQFFGYGEVFGGDDELIIEGNDPDPRPLDGSGASSMPPATPAPTPVPTPIIPTAPPLDPVRRAAPDDDGAWQLEVAYESRASSLATHAAIVAGDLAIQLPLGRRTGSFRLTQQWRRPGAWHVVGSHEGIMPASALGEDDAGTSRISSADSLLVLGDAGCFAMYRWLETTEATEQREHLQLTSPTDRWTSLTGADPGHEAGWVFVATGALPLHNMMALFDEGTMRLDGTGTDDGRNVVYVRGRGRYLRDYRPSGATRPDLRLGFDRDSLQPLSAHVRGSLFEVRLRVTEFSANYAQDPNLFAPPPTPAPFVAWASVGRAPLIVGGLKLNLDPYSTSGGWQLVSYPGFTLMLR